MSYRPRLLRRDRLPDQLLRPFDRGIKACLCPRLFLRYLAQNLINPRDGAKLCPGSLARSPRCNNVNAHRASRSSGCSVSRPVNWELTFEGDP